MTRKLIDAEDLHREWMKRPGYAKAHAELEDQYALASALIGARAAAGLTQEELARRMNTTQTVIARLESGGVMPSTRTLERFARATGHRLRISFEPLGERAEPASAGPPPEQAHATSAKASGR
jgi:transcriptional regulator with XRE-family HTH domain